MEEAAGEGVKDDVEAAGEDVKDDIEEEVAGEGVKDDIKEAAGEDIKDDVEEAAATSEDNVVAVKGDVMEAIKAGEGDLSSLK